MSQKITIPNLGLLTIREVLDYYDGPKIFVACNAVNYCYFVFWADEHNNVNEWFYVPISQKRLRKIRLGAISIRNAILQSETGQVYFVKQTQKFEFISMEEEACNEIDAAYLPPESDFLSYDYELEDEGYKVSQLKKLGCYVRLKFSKSRSKNIYLNNITSVLDSFKEYIVPILKSYGSKDSLVPLSAQRGSFILNIGIKKGEGLVEALEYIANIIKEKKIDRIEEYLRSNYIDPNGIYHLINAIAENQLNLDILISENEDSHFEKTVSVKSDTADNVRDVLRVIHNKRLSSIDVPQADEISRIFKLLKLSKSRRKIDAASLSVVPRQVSYYKQAARILNYFDEENNLTNLGFNLLKNNQEDMIKLTRIQFESSKCGWAWLNWGDVGSLFELDADSAADFLFECAPTLSESTARRRAQTLRSWHRTLTEPV